MRPVLHGLNVLLRSKHFLLCVLLGVVVFSLDLVTPVGVAGGVPYVIVVLACLWSPARHDAVAAAAVCSILTVAGFFLSPHTDATWPAVSNRLLALLAIWITALLVARRKQDLRDHERRLVDQMSVLVELAHSKAVGQGNLEEALREITRAAARVLRTERVGVWLLNAERTQLECVALYERSSQRHSRGGALSTDRYPAYFSAIEQRRVLAVDDARHDPRTREFGHDYLVPLGITSMLDAAIHQRGQMIGVVCHEHVGTRHAWTVEEQNFAGSIADFVDLALVASERRRVEQELREHRAHLEELVARRTAELTRVNAQLVEEIHDRKLAVEALEESEEKFRDLFEHSSDLIQSVTPDGKFLYVNPAWKKAIGYNDREIAQLTLFDVIHPDSLPHCQKLFRRVLAGETLDHVEVQFITKDGRTIVVEGSSSCRIENGKPVATRGTFRDVTRRKQAEERFARQAAELARSNAELERFAYAASHDLQEPLRAVAGHCRLLQQRYAGRLDADADELLEYAVDGATRMKSLIDGLLAYSRVGTRDLSIRSTDCEKVLDEALANLKVSIDDSAAVITRDRLPQVTADSTQLVELFQNLISNAIKYRGDRRPDIHIGAQAKNGMWVFSVRDRGIGIAPKHLERIFDVFQRLHTHDQYPGSGVGLAICKRILERMGGTIWVESQVGGGSTFYFALPGGKDGEA